MPPLEGAEEEASRMEERTRWMCDQKYGGQEDNQDCDANENPSRLEQVGQFGWEQQGQHRIGLEHEVSEHEGQQHLVLDGKFQFKWQQWRERVKSRPKIQIDNSS